MPYKIRVQKKRDEAPLRLVTRSEEWVEQVRSNPKWIWSSVGILLAVLVVYFGVWFMNRQAEEKAGVLEAEAFRLFHEPPPLPQPKEEGKPQSDLLDKTERLKKSVSLYDEILQKYPRSATARAAEYEIGNIYFELKDYDAAEKRYLAFLEKHPDQKDLASLAHLKLGYLYERKGNAEAAMKQFRTAYESEAGHNRDQAGFELARALEAGDKKSEAIELYKKISEGYAKSPWATEAKVRMDKLNPPTAAAPAPALSGTEPGKMTPPPAVAKEPSGAKSVPKPKK